MLYVLNDVPMFPAIYSQRRSGDIIEICYEVKIVLQILVYNHLALILQGNYQKASIFFFFLERLPDFTKAKFYVLLGRKLFLQCL